MESLCLSLHLNHVREALYMKVRDSLHVKLLLMLQIMHFLFSVRQNVSFFMCRVFIMYTFQGFLDCKILLEVI